jgi:hypothetical protein
MTRKDYILIVAALKHAINVSSIPDRRYGVERAALCLADALATDNPKFDRQRFLVETGVIDPPLQQTTVYVLCRTGSYQQWGQVSYSSRDHAQSVADHYNEVGEGPFWVKEKKL